MQIERDQLITHNIKKCHIILFRKQIKGNDSQWLETTFKYLVRYPLGEIIVCNARSLHACMKYSCYSGLSRFDISLYSQCPSSSRSFIISHVHVTCKQFKDKCFRCLLAELRNLFERALFLCSVIFSNDCLEVYMCFFSTNSNFVQVYVSFDSL